MVKPTLLYCMVTTKLTHRASQVGLGSAERHQGVLNEQRKCPALLGRESFPEKGVGGSETALRSPLTKNACR